MKVEGSDDTVSFTSIGDVFLCRGTDCELKVIIENKKETPFVFGSRHKLSTKDVIMLDHLIMSSRTLIPVR